MILELETKFSAAHFYQVENWSSEKNKANFGLCYNPWGHGHNYQVKIQFHVDSSINQNEILQLQELCNSVSLELEHRHLNQEIAEFKKKVPTTENIALYLAKKIASRSPFLHKLRLYEMPNLWVDIEWK